jgi:hypothetical protein
MSISDKLKSTQEMKNLQTKVRATQEQRHIRHDHLDPLQEQAEKMIAKLEIEKGIMEQIHLESMDVLK